MGKQRLSNPKNGVCLELMEFETVGHDETWPLLAILTNAQLRRYAVNDELDVFVDSEVTVGLKITNEPCLSG